jgi:hypothetical protein
MKGICLSTVALMPLTACQRGKQDPLISNLQASHVCEIDYGLTPDTPDFQNCKGWAIHHLQTGIKPDFAAFICDAKPTKQRESCMGKQQPVYQEMVRVNKEIEAFKEEDRKRREEERDRQAATAARLRQEAINKQKQVDHLKHAGYGLKKGTSGYADCRMKIEAERVDEERIKREMQALQWQQKQLLAAQAQEQQRRAVQRNFDAA